MLIDRASELERETSPDDLWTGAVAAFEAIGLPHVIYLMTDASRERVDLRTTVPMIYEDSDPGKDPFLDYCCNSYDATRTGVAYLPEHDYLPDDARRLIRAAEALGFRSGFGIPTRLEGSPRFGGFNLGSPLRPERFEAEIAPQLSDIRGFCLLLHRRFEELDRQATSNLAALSPREREILTLICAGASRKECARQLDLSPNTVAEYTKSAYRKLGVRNRAEAAVMLNTG